MSFVCPWRRSRPAAVLGEPSLARSAAGSCSAVLLRNSSESSRCSAHMHSSLSKLHPGVLALASLVALGCGGTEESAAAPASRRAPRVEPVQIAVAELSSAARSIAVTGTVEPIRTVGVVSQIAGVLQAVTVEEGDRKSIRLNSSHGYISY